MSFYALTPLAKADIFEIWSHIAQDNQNAADQVEAAIYEACAFVAESHHAATPDRSNKPTFAFLDLTRYRNFTVVFLPETEPLEVVAVLHGKRNLRRVLEQR
jgi:plasmid stabilization system protein ParE